MWLPFYLQLERNGIQTHPILCGQEETDSAAGSVFLQLHHAKGHADGKSSLTKNFPLGKSVVNFFIKINTILQRIMRNTLVKCYSLGCISKQLTW